MTSRDRWRIRKQAVAIRRPGPHGLSRISASRRLPEYEEDLRISSFLPVMIVFKSESRPRLEIVQEGNNSFQKRVHGSKSTGRECCPRKQNCFIRGTNRRTDFHLFEHEWRFAGPGEVDVPCGHVQKIPGSGHFRPFPIETSCQEKQISSGGSFP